MGREWVLLWDGAAEGEEGFDSLICHWQIRWRDMKSLSGSKIKQDFKDPKPREGGSYDTTVFRATSYALAYFYYGK